MYPYSVERVPLSLSVSLMNVHRESPNTAIAARHEKHLVNALRGIGSFISNNLFN